MEPSTILIALLCLALLVYLPKLRNTVFWILFPFVMVFVRYPKTRKPGLVVGLLGLAAGGVYFGVQKYQERRYWFCDIYSNKDHSVNPPRTSAEQMQCYRGIDACIKERDKPVDPKYADLLNSFDYEGERCGHRYPSIWSYDLQDTFTSEDKSAPIKIDMTEQFVSLHDCDQARGANLKIATSLCYRDEKGSK